MMIDNDVDKIVKVTFGLSGDDDNDHGLQFT